MIAISILTSLMGLGQAEDSDNARTYLVTTLAAALATIDAHAHEAGKGNPVKRIQSSVFASRAAAGNAGHVHVSTDQNRLSFDNGTSWLETIVEAQTRLLTLQGGLEVVTGGLGIAVTPSSNIGVNIGGTINASAQAAGIFTGPTLVAQADNDTLYASHIGGTFNPNGKAGITAAGLVVDPVTGASGTNYGVFVNTPSGATANVGLHNAGTTELLSTLFIGSGTYAQSGLVRIPNNNQIAWRNFNNNGDAALYFSAANQFVFSDTSGIIGEIFGSPGGGLAGLAIMVNDGAVTSLRQVNVGAADSGGTGYRTLRVPN